MHGGCNHFDVQVHYFIWQDNTISGQLATVWLLGDGQQTHVCTLKIQTDGCYPL